MVGGLSARLGLRGGAAPGGPLGGLRRPASGLSGGGGLRGLAWREAAQRRRPARPRSRADASLLAARSIASSRTSSGVDGAARRWTLSPSRPIAVFVDHYRMLIVNSLWMNWPAIQSQRRFVEVALANRSYCSECFDGGGASETLHLLSRIFAWGGPSERLDQHCAAPEISTSRVLQSRYLFRSDEPQGEEARRA